MAYVNTVLGPIHPAEMGVTAVQEYLWSGLPGWEYDQGFWVHADTGFEQCYHTIMDFKLLGGQTYVDCTGIGIRRNLDMLVKLASTSQVNIVASTGFGSDNQVMPHFRSRDIDHFQQIFVDELTRGIGQTQIKAGVITVGSKSGILTPLERAVLCGAARAAKATGAAVIARGAAVSAEQLTILTREGLDPALIIFSGLDSGDQVNVERDKKLARSGAFVAYTLIGVENWSASSDRLSDEFRVDLIRQLIEAGFQKQILLSTSSKCLELSWEEASLHNTAHLLRYFVPMIKHSGVSEQAIHQMLIDNPKLVIPIT